MAVEYSKVRLLPTYAHRSRGTLHLAPIVAKHKGDSGLRLISVRALCGASTALRVRRGVKENQRVRPGESTTPNVWVRCRKCLDVEAGLDIGHPPPGKVIPKSFLDFDVAPGWEG
jgi:hypothetical protein